MKATILREFSEGVGKCFLSEISLGHYLDSLPENYHKYEVQREIVKNAYLDDLISTILQQRHIPPIVLVVDEKEISVTGNNLSIGDFKILDGLQRTFRLNTIYETVKLLQKELAEDPTILNYSKLDLSKRYKEELERFNSSSPTLVKLISYYNEDQKSGNQRLSNLFRRAQWFEVWSNLKPDEEVTKMLILNAGHKPVKTKHQLELLFRNIIPVLNKVEFPEFKLVREKEMPSIEYTKNREVGLFHFSHLITSILSLGEGKPLTSNVDLIQKSQSNHFANEVYDEFLQLAFLKQFIKTLLELDKGVFEKFGSEGLRWIGRETSLVGIFAAVGKYMSEKHIKPIDALKQLDKLVVKNPASLNITEFEKQRNSLDLAKINFGNINKKAVYDGVYGILMEAEQVIDWAKYFKRA